MGSKCQFQPAGPYYFSPSIKLKWKELDEALPVGASCVIIAFKSESGTSVFRTSGSGCLRTLTLYD